MERGFLKLEIFHNVITLINDKRRDNRLKVWLSFTVSTNHAEICSVLWNCSKILQNFLSSNVVELSRFTFKQSLASELEWRPRGLRWIALILLWDNVDMTSEKTFHFMFLPPWSKSVDFINSLWFLKVQKSYIPPSVIWKRRGGGEGTNLQRLSASREVVQFENQWRGENGCWELGVCVVGARWV